MKTNKKIEKLHKKAEDAHKACITAESLYDETVRASVHILRASDIAFKIAKKAKIKADRTKAALLSEVETGKIIWVEDL